MTETRTLSAAKLEHALAHARAALRLALPILEAAAEGARCSIAAGNLVPIIKKILDR